MSDYLSYLQNTVTTGLKRKRIRSTITLVDDAFREDDDGSKKNQIIIDGLRTSCVVNYGNGAIMPAAEITIYGLSLGVMNKLLRVRWQELNALKNLIKIEAGDEGDEYRQVFAGNITFAFIDMANAPNTSLKITCQAALYEAYRPAAPKSYEGKVSVVKMIEDVCSSMGYVLENNGVPESVVDENIKLDGTDIDKIRSLAHDYRIDLYIEQGVIAITPQGEDRKLKIPIISPPTGASGGLIGYPVPTMQGVDFKCFYDPMIRFGGIVRIKDSLMLTCNGDWRCFGATINIESEVPNGNWFMEVKASHRNSEYVSVSK